MTKFLKCPFVSKDSIDKYVNCCRNSYYHFLYPVRDYSLPSARQEIFEAFFSERLRAVTSKSNLFPSISLLLLLYYYYYFSLGIKPQYSLNMKEYIVLEFLPFVDIPDIFEEIVASLEKRYENRKKSLKSSPPNHDNSYDTIKAKNAKQDKILNHLTVLSNAPGCGKSTAMMHFPLSAAYRNYYNRRTLCDTFKVVDDPPIICALTYNSGMDGGPLSVGMRILFGTMKAMGLCNDLQWKQFSEDFKDCESIRALKAVDIIRGLFGEQRLMLIIVDELSKAGKYDATAIKELGEILSNDDRTDILVSSLSPVYIDTLLTGSQRRTSYIPLRPLPVDQLGVLEFKAFAEMMIRRVENITSKPVDLFCKRLLLSTPALASGHGRSVQLLIESTLNSDCTVEWQRVETALIKNNSVGVLRCLVALPSLNKCIGFPLSSTERDMIFLPKPHDEKRNMKFRRMLEKGVGFIYKKDNDGFILSTTIAGLFKTISPTISKKSGSISLAVKSLFDPFPDNLSEIWERCCDLTLVGRSIVAVEVYDFPVFSPSRQTHPPIKLTDQLRVRIMTPGKTMHFEANTLVVPVDKNQPGFDSLVFGFREDNLKKAYAYNEVKIEFSAMYNLTKVVASKLVSVLDFHFKHMIANECSHEEGEQLDETLKSIFFNLYLYSSSSANPVDVSTTELTRELAVLRNSKFQRLESYKNEIENKKKSLKEDKTNPGFAFSKQKELKRREKALQTQMQLTLPSQSTLTGLYLETVVEDRAIRFVELCGEKNINIFNRDDMGEWLLSTVVPLATIVQAVQAP